MNCRVLALALATVLPAGSTPSRTVVWYDIGHRLVARIAESRLAPHTALAVRDLLGGEDLADASLWADQVRGQRRDTGPLHYVNIPLDAETYVTERDCPGGACIIAAIEQDRRILADTSASLPERAEALRFLIHFMGDLHQPLHVSDNGDRGGNQRQVALFSRPFNLHQVWDGELIEATGLDESQYLDRLQREMPSLDLDALERGSVVDWAMEGHRVAAEHAYQLPRSGHLGDAYLAASLPLVDHQLIAAGVRLAKVLNEALAEYRPSPPVGSTLPPNTWSDREAAAHVGEEGTVVGTVVTVYRSKAGNIYLNFGAEYPRQTFSGAVLNPRDPALLDLDSLAGRRIGVRGRIQRYKGQPEIVIERADQIVSQP